MKNKALKITCIVSLIMICFVYHHYLNTDTKQIKFGATYMTMNNTFYKAVNNEIENVIKRSRASAVIFSKKKKDAIALISSLKSLLNFLI